MPLLAAAISVPYLIEIIGLERLGLLTIAWGLIGFAGVFDMGVGRATTQMISQLINRRKFKRIPTIISVASNISLRMGLIGAFILGVLVFFNMHERLKFDQVILKEVTIASYLLAIAIPVQTISAMYRGINEAFESFREINIIRMTLGVANFIGPLLISFFTVNIAAMVLTLLLSRLAALYFFNKYAYKKVAFTILVKSKKDNLKISKIVYKQLFAFGGWITISNVIYPIMMQSDRLLIGILISATAVATYVIPYEMVIQTLIICGAITTTIFPILSGLAKSDDEKIEKLFSKWLTVSVVVMFMVTSIFLIFANDILKIWLGSSLDGESVAVARILSLGLIPYALGSMYLAIIHAYARPDITAKAHLIEIPIFIVTLYWSLNNYGIIGAAIVWVGRVIVDAFLLVFWFHRVFKSGNKIWQKF